MPWRRRDGVWVVVFVAVVCALAVLAGGRRSAPTARPTTPIAPIEPVRPAPAVAAWDERARARIRARIDEARPLGVPWDIILVHDAACPGVAADGAGGRHHFLIGGGEILPRDEVEASGRWRVQAAIDSLAVKAIDRRAIVVACEGATSEGSAPAAAAVLIAELAARFHVPPTHILAHRDLQPDNGCVVPRDLLGRPTAE